MLVLLKSDAYGHSLKVIAQELDSLPSSARLHGFGVANVEEGIELRRLRVSRHVYVLSGIQNVDDDMVRCLKTCNLIPVISSLHALQQLCKALRGGSQLVHLKFNTGMNRLGIDIEEVPVALRMLKRNPNVQVEGLMSHYAMAEEIGSSLTKYQTKNFRAIQQLFQKNQFHPKFLHLENSAGIWNDCFPEGNIVRAGLHLYGIGQPELMPVAKWTAQVYQIRSLKKGATVGYGARFRAKKAMRMAVLGVGYGDGYRRALSNRADVLIHGKRCPVIGSVSMDLTAVDISALDSISTKSRAVLMGRDGEQEVRAEELASHANCIPWEIVTGISPRVPRSFIHGRT